MAKQSFKLRFQPKEVCFIDSVYTLLVYLLANKCEVKDVLFFFHRHIPEHIANNFNYVRSYGRERYMFSKRYLFHNMYCGLKFHFFMSINHLYGIKHSGMDHLPLARRLINRKGTQFYEYEDGTSSYQVTNAFVKDTIINRLFHLDVEPFFGQSDKVVKVFLAHPELDIPSFLKNKVQWVDLKALWDKLPSENKQWILKMYRIPAKEELGDRHTVLMTRPFSEFGYNTEKDKVELFAKCLDGIEMSDLVIKPHYIETTNYKDLFPQSLVLKGQYPIELLCLAYGSIIREIVTIGTCSAEPFFRRYYPEIKYSIIDNEMFAKI